MRELRSFLPRAASCVALALVACTHPSRERAEPTHHVAADGTVTIEGDSAAWVRVEPAEAAPSTARRALFARIGFDEARVSAVGAPVSGRVTAVNVTTGQDVPRGAPLLVVHSADVAASRAAVLEARQARMLASDTATRARLLQRQGAGSEADALAAETALAEAQLEERRAGEALGAIGGSVGEVDFVLHAPRAGTVVERAVQVGNAVAADSGAPLVTIADLSRVWVLVDVYEHDLASVNVGDSAHVTVSALSNPDGSEGRRYEGRIAYVGAVVDAASRAARARIELDNGDLALRPGMFAEVEVESRETAAAVVPASAVLARRDQTYVFVATSDTTFQPRRVRLGTTRGEQVSVLEGIAAGDRVVVRGAILLDAEANMAF